MISEFMRCLAAALLLADHAFAACEGPDEGEATTVVTVPANENCRCFPLSRHAARERCRILCSGTRN
jgi:hypothetical protein